MAGPEPGGWSNARANCRPAGLAVRRPRSGGRLRGGLTGRRAACGPCPDTHPRRAPAAVTAAAPGLGRQASVPTAPPASCLLGGLRLLEVLVDELAVDVVDRLDLRLDVGLLAGAVVGRLRGRGAGLLLGLGDLVAVLARLALDRAGQLAVAARQRALGDLLERLARPVGVRARQHRPAALAVRERELVRVVLAGEHDERAAVQLPRGFRAL